MDTKQLETIGINPLTGGRAQVIAGEVSSVSESTSKAGVRSVYIDIAYKGGTESLRLEPGHPLTKINAGSEVVVAFSWTDTQWGARPHQVMLLNGPKAA